MPNNISVSITADVADLQVKRAIMSAELKAATKDLNTFAKEAAAGGGTEELRAGMLASAQAAETARNAIAQVNAEMKAMRPASEEAHGAFGRFSEGVESINLAREAMMKFGEAMIAAFAVERIVEWGRTVGEAAEKIAHTAITFGMTANEVMRLNGEMIALGIAPEAATTAFTRLDRATLQAREGNKKLSETFKQIGIDINEPMSQTKLFQKTIEGLAQIQDVPTRIGVAMQLLGRNIQEIAPLIGLTTEQINEAKTAVDEYGYSNDDAQAKGLALAEAFNVNKVATQGLTNVLVQEFGPGLVEVIKQMDGMIKEFIESYRRGGAAKQMLQDIGVACKGLSVFVVDVTALFVAFGETINAIAYVIQGVLGPVVEGIKVAFVELGDAASTAGKIIYDALHLDWANIREDFRNGLSQMSEDARAGGKNIGDAFQKGMSAAGNSFSAAGGALGFANKFAGAMFDGKEGDDKYDPHALDEIMGRNKPSAGFNPAKVGGGGHQKKAEDHTFQNLEAELEKQKLAYAKLQDEQGTYQQFSLASEEKFWADALNRTDLSEKARNEITKKWLAIRQSLLKEKQAAETEDAKQSAALATESAKLDSDLAKMALQDKIAAIDAARNAGKISTTEEIREKADINQQLLDLEKTSADAIYKIRLKELQAERAILGETPAYYKKIDDQITLLAQQHADQEVLINRKKVQTELTDEQKLAVQQRSILNQSFQGFSQNIAKMVTLQQGFAATFKGIWQSLQNIVAQAIDNMVLNWLVGLASKEAASKAFHMKQVLIDAKQAAAGAWNAMVHIPIIGPILAPIAAAASFAGVMAFGSAEGGDWQTREGPYQLHKDEMVLPAWAAQPLRNMVSSGAGGFSPGAAANDSSGGLGDLHVHVTAMDAHSVKRLFMNHKGPLAQAVKKYARDGGR